MTLQETGSSAPRMFEVGVILATIQGGSRACRYFRDERRTAVLDHLLTGGGIGSWTVADGTKLLDVLRSLRYRKVSAAEVFIGGDPDQAELLERGYAIGRDQHEATPPFAEASIRRILELLAKHFPPGVELDGMIAAVEARLLDAVVPYFIGKLEEFDRLERWEAHHFRLKRLREHIETFLRELRGGTAARGPVPPSTPAFTQLFERLEAAEHRAAECPSRPQTDPYLFRASAGYQTGRHDTERLVTLRGYDAFAAEAQCVPANGHRVLAFQLMPQFGLLTLTDVHFHLQASVLKRAGFVPRLGVDYVLRVGGAREVNVLTCHPAILDRLLRCRVNMPVRTGAPYHCISTRGPDLRDHLGIPCAVRQTNRGPSGTWVHVG